MVQVCSSEAIEKQVAVPPHHAVHVFGYWRGKPRELRHAETRETLQPHEARVDAPVRPSSPVAAPISSAQLVLANDTLFLHIVSFQDGLPGLLHDLKLEAQESRGALLDVASAAAKRNSIRAFEMIEVYRAMPEHANRYDLRYHYGANVACEEGNAAVLRWIINCPTLEHRENRRSLKAMWLYAVSGFKPGNFSVLELLAEYFTPAQVKKLESNTWSRIQHVELLQWLTERYTITVKENVFNNAVYRKDEKFVDYWLAHRPEPMPEQTLTSAIYAESWFLFLRLILNKERVPDEKERMELIMMAVEQQDLTLLRLLHMYQSTYPFEKAPVEALELAAAHGHLELFDELYLHHKDIISARAFEMAASNGHLHLLEFMFTRSLLEGIPEAMDGAATNGHLECVRFLHEKRLFKATTKAMDSAATNGHLDVVKFFHESRQEGCTAQALVGATENAHEEVVKWLIENRSEVRCAAGLDGLLLGGKTSEWLFYREEWKLFNDDAVDGTDHISDLMYEAGRKGKMAAVRFIVKTLNREDLLTRAYDGAAEMASVGWFFAINALDTTKQKRVQFSTIQRAVQAEKESFRFATLDGERLDAFKWMILQCADKDAYTALRETLKELKALREDDHRRRYHCYDQVDILEDLTRWSARRQPTPREMQKLRQTYATGVFSFATRGSSGDWVVEYATKTRLPRFTWTERQDADGDRRHEDPWLLGQWTLPKRAVVRNDLTVLYYCHELSQSTDCAEADAFRIDDNVLRAAIATGHLNLIKWYAAVLSNGTLEGEDLFECAVKYGQPDVAEWLLATHPKCCTELSADRFDVWAKNVDHRIFDWFDRLEQDHPELLKHLQPRYIAYSLAYDGEVELLERLINTHTQLRYHLAHILSSAANGGHAHSIKFVSDLMEKRFSPNGEPIVMEDDDSYEVQVAIARLANEGKLEMVEFLYNKFPHASKRPGVSLYSPLRGAAERGKLRVVRYLIKNHFPKGGDLDEVREYVPHLSFFWSTQGVEFL